MLVDDDEVCQEMVDSKDTETGDASIKDGVTNEIVTPQKLKLIPRPPFLFPQRLKNTVGRR